jgi:hypothetical protein
MKEVKTNKYYAFKYLIKELKAQQKDIDKDIHERENNVKNRALICANNLVDNRIKNNRMEDTKEARDKIINSITTEYLRCMKESDERREKE